MLSARGMLASPARAGDRRVALDAFIAAGRAGGLRRVRPGGQGDAELAAARVATTRGAAYFGAAAAILMGRASSC
jgi:hypothetical protein